MTRRSVNEHRDAVDALLAPLAKNRAAERLGVSADAVATRPDDYRARILAHDLLAPADLPAFDNSQMDGYAVSWFDLVTASPADPVHLTVAPQIAAGDAGAALAPGTAAPIMTGAPVPPGADAIVPIEEADPPRFGTGTDAVTFVQPVTPGTFIRRVGSDVSAGEILLAAGALLGPAQFGVIAGTGLTEIEVVRRIRVLLISTGHEIREPGTQLGAGQIFDSNSLSMTLALTDAGCTVTAVPCRSDDAADLLAILRQHAPDADMIVTVGGVSAGAREVVRDALGPLGVAFTKVAMQPGGPQGLGLAALPLAPDPAPASGTGSGVAEPTPSLNIPVLCLPGNPVSALVSFEMFIRPALRRLALREPTERLREVAMLADAVDSPPGIHQVRRGFVNDDGTVTLIGGPSSHLLHSYASSNALVHFPVDAEHLDAGDPVMVWRIDD